MTARSISCYRRDPLAPLAARAEARVLLQRWRGGDTDALAVLPDVLLYSDAPELGEQLAYILDERTVITDRDFARVIKRIEDELSFPSAADRREYHARQRRMTLDEMRGFENNWRVAPLAIRRDALQQTGARLEIGNLDVWLRRPLQRIFDGELGTGPQVVAREIADQYRGRRRETALFRLVLSLDRHLPAAAADAVWRRLPSERQAAVTEILREVLADQGATA